jgi:arginase
VSSRRLAVIGVPSSAGAFANGQELAPRALRDAGLLTRLRGSGLDVEDMGDSAEFRWRPDRDHPRAQNLDAVVTGVRTTSDRVATAISAGRVALVLGGDCTVGVGTVAGARQVLGAVGLIYFDLHADMNTPASVVDGALDWTGVAHMLALEGTDPKFASAVLPAPLMRPEDILLFAHGDDQATEWEREQIETLGMKRFLVEAVAADPAGVGQLAVRRILEGHERYVVHLDVDVIDFTDAPLSENTGRGIGLSFDAAMIALRALLESDRLIALTVTELNPVHAAADEGLINRFADPLAGVLV